MLIFTDEQRERAGIKSLSKRCSHCRKPLLAYPLIVSDDAIFGVYHVECATDLATDILVDLSTFFCPGPPYVRLFTLDPKFGPRECKGGDHAIDEPQRD
jgi:hypothetical protein